MNITTQAELDAAPKGEWHELGPGYFEVREGMKVDARSGSTVDAYSGSTVHAYSGSTVHAWDGSTVDARSGSTVHAWDGSTVYAWDGSTVDAHSGSKVDADNGSKVRDWNRGEWVERGANDLTLVEPTKESLDALIEGTLNDLGAKYGYHLEQRVIRQVALREFRDAILASQPERVEPQFKCGDAVEWFGHAAIVEAVTFDINWGDEPRYEIVIPSDENQRHYDILGQSLKGAGE